MIPTRQTLMVASIAGVDSAALMAGALNPATLYLRTSIAAIEERRVTGEPPRHCSLYVATCCSLLAALTVFVVGCSTKSAGGEQLDASALLDPVDNCVASGPEIPSADVPRVQIVPIPRQSPRGVPEQCFSLGSVGSGESVRRMLIVENRTSERLVIDGFATSCECLAIDGLPITLVPRSQEHVECAFDLSNEPEFRGDLAVQVTLKSRETPVAVLKVGVSVPRAHDDGNSR